MIQVLFIETNGNIYQKKTSEFFFYNELGVQGAVVYFCDSSEWVGLCYVEDRSYEMVRVDKVAMGSFLG